MSGSRTAMPAQSGQQAPAERELVFCHECQNEWFRDEHGLTCPDCQSEFTEIIENNRSDPREDAFGSGGYAEDDSDDDDDDDNDPMHAHQHPTGGSAGFRMSFGGPDGMRFESIRGGFPSGNPFEGSQIRGGNDRSPIDEHGRPQPRHPNWGTGEAQSPVAEMFASIIQNIMGQPNPNGPAGPSTPQANRTGGLNQDHGFRPSPVPSRSNAGSPFGLFPGFPPSPAPRNQGGHSHSTTIFERRTMGPDGHWRIERSASNSPMPGFGVPPGMPGSGPRFGSSPAPGNPQSPQPQPHQHVHDDRPNMGADEINNIIMSIFGGLGNGPDGMSPFLRAVGLGHGNGGDYAYTQADMDRILSQLMEQHQGNAPPPASAERISNLPKEKVSQKEIDEGTECVVCQDDFKPEEEVVRLPCKHIYHEECVKKWLESHDACPICRTPITPESERPSRSNNPSAPGQGPPGAGSGGSGSQSGSGSGSGFGGPQQPIASGSGSNNGARWSWSASFGR